MNEPIGIVKILILLKICVLSVIVFVLKIPACFYWLILNETLIHKNRQNFKFLWYPTLHINWNGNTKIYWNCWIRYSIEDYPNFIIYEETYYYVDVFNGYKQGYKQIMGLKNE